MRPSYRSVLVAAGAAALVASAALPAGASCLPRRIYAPYFEAWTKDSIATVAGRSGARYFTLAFIQAAGKKGAAACTPTWNGKQPISAGRYLAQIARVRKLGGDVIPSFGGYSADHGGTDSNTCSGITQNTWDFSHILEPFTS